MSKQYDFRDDMRETDETGISSQGDPSDADGAKSRKRFSQTRFVRFIKRVDLTVLLCYVLAGLLAFFVLDKFFGSKTPSAAPEITTADAATEGFVTVKSYENETDSADLSAADVSVSAVNKIDALRGAEPINVNDADETELQRLPGVGPATASAIVDYRTENGPFTTVDDLLKVKGIGYAKLEKMRPYITVQR